MKSHSSQTQIRFSQVGLTILLVIIFLIENSALAFYSALQIQQSPLLPLLFSFSISSLLAIWVHYDSHLTGYSMGLDQAIYLFYAWPITFPLYIYRTRGFRSGSFLLIILVGIYILTLIATFILVIIINMGSMIP